MINELMCGRTIRNIHNVTVRKPSEMNRLSGSNSVRTFLKKQEIISKYLVSMRTKCTPQPPRGGI